MSVPNNADYAIIKMGDGATPTEVFTALCGTGAVSINSVSATATTQKRDCAAPWLPGTQTVRSTGKAQTIQGTGAVDKADIAKLNTALGVNGNYQIELYKRNATTTGHVLYGTWAGNYHLSANNMAFDPEGDATGEFTLESNGAFPTWTPTV